MTYDDLRNGVDTSKLTIDSYSRKIDKPWGWELHFTPDTLPYMGKIIHVNAGARLSLQAHDKKQESWIKLRGDARVIIEDETGGLQEVELSDGEGITCKIGQRHRLKAGETDADILEVSTPEIGTTFRLEDDYKRTDETEEEREKRNEEAA